MQINRVMKSFQNMLLEFLMDSAEYNMADYDLYEVEKELKPLINGVMLQYFYLKQKNPKNKVENNGLFFIHPLLDDDTA